MTKQELLQNIQKKNSFLCVGLDTDIKKIPVHLFKTEDPVFEFNKAIIDATKDYCIAYKPNIAFYECLGASGWNSLEKTVQYINEVAPDVFTIADAKRGDIGNTSDMYARTFFEYFPFDSVTVAPYMGEDSVSPFLQFQNKWVILLALTSNKGALNFQFSEIMEADGTKRSLFEKVITISQKWGSADNMMYVVGATQGSMISRIRKLIPDHFFLVPGVGAQGGDLEEVVRAGINAQCGLIVNSSRNIIYAGDKEDFAERARMEAAKLQQQMAELLEKYLNP